MDDHQLVTEVLQGNGWAFRQLVGKHQRLVTHMVARLVDEPADREELCQDVFLRVHEKLDTFHFQSKLSTWIATIAWRTSINWLRKKKRQAVAQDLDQVAFSLGSEDLQLEQADMAQFVHRLIAQMPETYRTILTLYHLEDFSYAEIVEVTGMPEGTVKNYLFRARAKLKELATPYIGTEIFPV